MIIGILFNEHRTLTGKKRRLRGLIYSEIGRNVSVLLGGWKKALDEDAKNIKKDGELETRLIEEEDLDEYTKIEKQHEVYHKQYELYDKLLENYLRGFEDEMKDSYYQHAKTDPDIFSQFKQKEATHLDDIYYYFRDVKSIRKKIEREQFRTPEEKIIYLNGEIESNVKEIISLIKEGLNRALFLEMIRPSEREFLEDLIFKSKSEDDFVAEVH